MNYTASLQAFLARYFPTFIGAFFLAVLSISSALSLVESTYLGSYNGLARAMFVITIVLSLTLTFASSMMIRGRTWGLWIIVALLNHQPAQRLAHLQLPTPPLLLHLRSTFPFAWAVDAQLKKASGNAYCAG